MKEAFREWIFKEDERALRLVRADNDEFNAVRLRNKGRCARSPHRRRKRGCAASDWLAAAGECISPLFYMSSERVAERHSGRGIATVGSQ